MDSDLFDPLEKLFRLLLWTALLAVPLALWKVCELVWWFVTHVRVE